MARPQPRILRETYMGSTLKRIQIARSPGVWAVTYQGQPFTLIHEWDTPVHDQHRKYPKTVFTNSGHAENLARKLNHWFACEDFDIELMIPKEKDMGAGPVRMPGRKTVPNPIPGKFPGGPGK